MKTRFTELVGCELPIQLAAMGGGVCTRAAHAGGALAGWQVGSVAEAAAADESGCDYLVAQGIEAGGHVRPQSVSWNC